MFRTVFTNWITLYKEDISACPNRSFLRKFPVREHEIKIRGIKMESLEHAKFSYFL